MNETDLEDLEYRLENSRSGESRVEQRENTENQSDGLRRRRAAKTLEIDAVEEVEKELNRERVKISEPCVYMKDYKILFEMEIQILY